MTFDDILTTRLRLVTVSDPLLEADFGKDQHRFASLLKAEIPTCWPPEHWEPHCFDFLQTQFTQHPHTRAWGRYVVLQQPSVLIGTLGAFPRNATEIEIGYGILPPWQRQGYATEAAQTLVDALLQREDTLTISAQTVPHLLGSVGVMRRCGMQFAGPGDEPGTVRYRLNKVS